jgi:hypothetical protein
MAFNADEYIDVIVGQIAGNFQELGENVEEKKNLDEQLKTFRETQALEKLPELSEKIKAQKENYRNIEPLTVGLFGEWGSGKTHLLKLIESKVNEIQLDQKRLKKEQKTFPQITIPVFFNAWRFEKEAHMIIPLFQTMLTQLEAYEHKSLGEEAKTFLSHTVIKFRVLAKALKSGLRVPEKIAEVPQKIKNLDVSVLGDVLNTDTILKAYDEKIKEELLHDELFKELTENRRLESIYYHIPEWIEKITISDDVNFIFLIDDLDRCLPENTLKMLESIKLFLDVPSCAFVLAIDDDVVERGVAYHYRDYLQSNNNIVINLEKKEEEKQENGVAELPITGHEYLEKMVQLPFRIPVIGTENVYEFLESRYRKTFEAILNEDKKETKQVRRESKDNEIEELKTQQSQTDMILEFFSKTIPPKPRKIKRTAMLFETKVRLLSQLEIELRPKLIAKMTLLELFAPKLLRFIQNNGYVRMYDRLVHFKSLDNPHKQEEEETEKLTLADVEEIKVHIESNEANYSTKEKELFHKLMEIVTQSRSSRMVFDLDAIFDTRETQENLKLNIELMKPKAKKVPQTLTKFTYLSESSLEKLFRPNDPASWADAFRDNQLLADGEALLSNEELNEIISEAKKKEAFAKDPEWMGIVANYVSNEQYIHLLKELYEYRFADINGQFKMGIYQVTFAEYDRYAKLKNLELINDKEWGRGKRPVMRVNWHEATEYAKWLTQALGVEYGLPKEDEWYLACNNGKESKWHFGNDEKALKEYAWYDENSDGKTHPVGLKMPNDFGLYDMYGNVWEWCEDWYDEEEKYKVLRGGSLIDNADDARSSYRDGINPSYRNGDIGFRLIQRT